MIGDNEDILFMFFQPYGSFSMAFQSNSFPAKTLLPIDTMIKKQLSEI